MNPIANSENNEIIKDLSIKISDLKKEIQKKIMGQEETVDKILVGLFCQGHLLIEGLPGLAKTFLAKTLATSLDLNFKRVQFTPDILPADITGTNIFNQKNSEFEIRKGPVFTNILLADEINRSPAKVQSALLQCMEERMVTIGDQTLELQKPFMVIATENPIDQEGTYVLPEAQMDRFLMKILMQYPKREDEKSILDEYGKISESKEDIKKILSGNEILKIGNLIDSVFIDEKLKNYILDLIRNTRPETNSDKDISKFVKYGSSPRAMLSMLKIAKVNAAIQGRNFVIADDIKNFAKDVLRHRIILSFDALTEDINTEIIIDSILESTKIE